jgi:hypothetical protein
MKLLRNLKLFFAMAVLTVSWPCYSADAYIGGNVTNITSIPAGLLVMLDSGTPTNCKISPYSWMLIKAENKTMIAVALAMFSMGNKGVVVYTNPPPGAGAFCEISQYDPIE